MEKVWDMYMFQIYLDTDRDLVSLWELLGMAETFQPEVPYR